MPGSRSTTTGSVSCLFGHQTSRAPCTTVIPLVPLNAHNQQPSLTKGGFQDAMPFESVVAASNNGLASVEVMLHVNVTPFAGAPFRQTTWLVSLAPSCTTRMFVITLLSARDTSGGVLG